MAIYFGSLDALRKIPCAVSQITSYAETHAFTRTVEGKVKAQKIPFSRREWSITGETGTPASFLDLQNFARGNYGPGPFFFLSEEASRLNILSPDCADLTNAYSSSALSWLPGEYLPDGSYAPRVLYGDKGLIVFGREKYPVNPTGSKITASAWLWGVGSYIRFVWYRADGSLVSITSSTITGKNTGWVRSWVTATPPAEAVSFQLSAVSVSKAAHVQATWGDTLTEAIDGYGCTQAVLEPGSRNLVSAWGKTHFSQMSYKITEVG